MIFTMHYCKPFNKRFSFYFSCLLLLEDFISLITGSGLKRLQKWRNQKRKLKYCKQEKNECKRISGEVLDNDHINVQRTRALTFTCLMDGDVNYRISDSIGIFKQRPVVSGP